MSIHGRTGTVTTTARTTTRAAALALLVTSVVVSVAMVSAAASGAVLPNSTRSEAASTAAAAPQVGPPFKVATYNALFASHTDGRKPKRPGYPNSTVRTKRAVELFRRSGIDIAGFQEFELSARRKFKRLAPEYRIFDASARSVGWRRDEFKFIEGHTIPTRTYYGRLARTPVVTLRQRATGQHLVVMSVHNPANVNGPAEAYRDDATQQELAKVLRYRHTSNPVPVIVLGDMNDKADFFCPFTKSGDMHAAAGGSHVNSVCDSPSFNRGIDWIMGSTDVAFSRFRDDYNMRLATDHPLITAVARITTQSANG